MQIMNTKKLITSLLLLLFFAAVTAHPSTTSHLQQPPQHLAQRGHVLPVVLHHCRLHVADGQQQRDPAEGHALVLVMQQVSRLVSKLLHQLRVLLQNPARDR
jgi:hypothetical protein